MNGLTIASYVLRLHLGGINAAPETTGGPRVRFARAAGLFLTTVAIVSVGIATFGGTI